MSDKQFPPRLQGYRTHAGTWVAMSDEAPSPAHTEYLSLSEHEALLSAARAEARADALEEAAKEVDAWRDLIEVDHRDILAKGQYKDPQDAGREYRNKQNLLGSVAHGIRDKAKSRGGESHE